MLKILSWNIQQGGGSRVLKICSSLVKFSAEIIILSEYKNNANGNKIRSTLLNAGYRYQHVSPAASDANSAAIFSKIPCNQVLFPNSDLEFANNILASQFDAFNVYGMYLPHKKKHTLFDFLITEAANDKPGIFAGDFNTGINYVDQKGDSFWYTDKLKTLNKNGYIDAFRSIHGNLKEYSWYSHQGNGYRYDHTYIHESLIPILKQCYYLHEWRIEKLADHSPMVIELG